MRHVAGAIVVLLALTVSAQSPGLAEARKDMNAAAARQDKMSFASFLSDDITSIDSAGKLRDKAAAIEDMPSGNTQTNAEIYVYGDGAVVAIGYNQSSESPARIIQAWAKRGDRWQMVAFQGVRARGNVVPATQRSSTLSASSGPQSDRNAVQKTLDAIDMAARSSDAPKWAALATNQFVSTSSTGEARRKDEHSQEIAAARAQQVRGIREVSMRIHGALAVVTRRFGSSGDVEFWQTVIFVKEGGAWKAAAEVTTPITGAARSLSR